MIWEKDDLSEYLRCAALGNKVISEDFDEALRLIDVSKASLHTDAQAGVDQSPASKIYNLIRGMRGSGAAAVGAGRDGELSMRKVRDRILAKGFTEDQLASTIDEYALLDVWQITGDGTRLVFIDIDEDMDL